MSLGGIWPEIESLYDASDASKREVQALKELLPLIEKKIADRYTIEKRIAKGGAGLILKVADTNLSVSRALKVPRPISGRENLLTTIITSEISKLKGLSHPNIVQIFLRDEVQFRGTPWPFYVMEYVEGGQDCYQYITSRAVDQNLVVSITRQLAEGLAHLHSKDMIHGDVKLENALMSPSGRLLISDLGSARSLSDGPGETQITFTRPYAHPRLRQLGNPSPTELNRDSATLQRSSLERAFDLYAFGQNIFRLLTTVDPDGSRNLTPYAHSYLELLAARLLDGENRGAGECPLHMPAAAFVELKYVKVDDCLLDLRKLTNEYSLWLDVPELDPYSSNTIQAAFPGACAFTKRLADLLAMAVVNRLAEISQLGLMVYVYPSANHTRLEHVLGVYANSIRYVNALYNDPINPIFRQIVSAKAVRSVLCAALCHDIGQYGLAHDFEEANNEVFSHTALTARVLRGTVPGPVVQSLRDHLEDDWDVDPDFIADILEVNPNDLSKPIVLRLLHTIVDGPIDVDKLDYLTRDSSKLGIPYAAGLDIDRLVRCLTVAFKTEGTRLYIALGVHEKGKITAESMAFCRYAMFGSVYWHHTSRACKSMLHRAIWEALPSIDKRTTEYNAFKSDFENYAFSRLLTHEYQPALFEKDERIAYPAAYQLSVGDWRMLEWLHTKTSTEGKLLVTMLLSRTLYKRLLVISHRKNSHLYEQLQQVRSRNKTELNVSFQKDVQTELIGLLKDYQKKAAIDGATTTAFAPDDLDKTIIADSIGSILVLVDIPPERGGSELQFLSETRIRGTRRVGEVAPALEDSVVWNAIGSKFHESVGKVRVFVHPDYATVFEVCLDRTKIEQVLEATARKHVGG
jgi:HD superfamily phosphohydrolase